MDTDRLCRKLGKKGLFQIQGYQATGNVWEKDKKTLNWTAFEFSNPSFSQF